MRLIHRFNGLLLLLLLLPPSYFHAPFSPTQSKTEKKKGRKKPTKWTCSGCKQPKSSNGALCTTDLCVRPRERARERERERGGGGGEGERERKKI